MPFDSPQEFYRSRMRSVDRRRLLTPRNTGEILDLATRLYQRLALPLLRLTFPPMLFCFLGLIFFAWGSVLFLWRDGVVSDPLAIGAAGPLLFAIAGCIAVLGYAGVVGVGLLIRRSL